MSKIKENRSRNLPSQAFRIKNRSKIIGTGAYEEEGIPNSNKSKATNRQNPKRKKR